MGAALNQLFGDGRDLLAVLLQLGGGLDQLVLVAGHEHEIAVTLGEEPGQLVAPVRRAVFLRVCHEKKRGCVKWKREVANGRLLLVVMAQLG